MKNWKLFIPFVALLLISSISGFSQEKKKYGDLPIPAKEELKTKYKKYAINSIFLEDEDGKSTFKVEVQKKSTGYYLVYDLDGILLSKTKFKSFSFDGTEPVPDRSGAESSPLPPI
ncbi:MAG: hypothetical protein ACPGD5_03395 [Salibacteraceae bacterium]